MEKWIHESLSELLDFPIPEDLTSYILQMQNPRDLDEYLKSLLDFNNPKHKQFVAELKKRHASFNDQTGYRKTNDATEDAKKQNEKKKNKVKGKENVADNAKIEKAEKKKTKFVNLYSQDGSERTILLKGRHKCDCEAKKHTLINNCLSCGRIICKQEGSGPCFFCGYLVCSPEEQAILLSNTKQSDNLYNKLMEQKPNKNLEDSVKQRNKLLEYDRNSSRRTKVIDDECDYYQSNSTWLSTKEREKLQKLEDESQAQKHASRLERKVKLDFMGREVIEDNTSIEEMNEEQLNELCESISVQESDNICPMIEFDRPLYIEQNAYKPISRAGQKLSINGSRIQDKEYLEMADEGLCLSMHQPYASLLVAGIKTHEGRTWYSSHRGRLWIASTVKPATTEEISKMQRFYQVLKNENIQFPDNYPSGCLLGCVTVVDVLPQEEYRKQYPVGESESPFVFICENCYTLPIKFPMKGKHKIYKLDKKIHQAALKSLDRVMKEVGSYCN